MLAYPDTQKKAQEELDRALGGALPTFDDLESGRLPYMTALVKECLRWRSVAPMGFPHIAAEDDVYNGYTIPKGSIVLANLWSMMHDPSIYPDPEQFMPERFLNLDGRLKSDILSPEDIVFGFGRRICPARILAFSSVWMVTASTLAVFNVSKAVDKNGRVIEPTYESAERTDRQPATITR
ncbi:hypothetical protein MPER_02709 [Moniliophthora perniciosa FA553]|nr:hypothetical protein MPER_02709 [Moniliophthora perniciosa FA553]